ncbi:MAG TPA: hypothetical protein VE077_17890 [Candidatus Methylomirabilis sp.]|nr:hypothetical protein [Candidatus Methylomirabilis sp.]
MFCPQCKAEYRPGFTHCVDCDVDLVVELPKESLEKPEPVTPGDPSDDPFCMFWQGDDPRIHAEICGVLDEESIPHKTVRRADHLFNLTNYAAFQIGVPFSMFERAENAVKEAYETAPQDLDPTENLAGPRALPQNTIWFKPLPPRLTPGASEDVPGPPIDGDLSEWHADDAAAEIWTGADDYLCGVLIAALHENQIHVAKRNENGKQVLSVLSPDEAQAREIVHEVLDGQPPE